MFKRLKKIKLTRPDIHRWDRRVQSVFQITWRVSLLILIVGLFSFLYKSTQDESYSIKAFHVPESFEDAGYNGLVVAQKLMDELEEVNVFINSSKAQQTDIHTDLQPDLNVQVMGIGLTLNSFTYHLRKILGKENRAISGELTDIDHQLKLTVRVSSEKPVTISKSYEDGEREAALVKLFHEGAKDIMGKMDPYRMAVYHYKKEEFETSMEYIMRVINERPEERHWAYLAWSSWLNLQGRTEESIEKLKQALAIEEDFSVALTNLGWRYFTQKDYVNALQTFKRINESNPSESSAWNGRALCHGILGETDDAEECYAMAVKKSPQSIAWYGNWAWFRYNTMKDTMGAVQIFEKARQNLPESPELYMSIGGTYTYRNDLDSAAIFAQKAYDMDPYNAMTLQAMTNIFYDQADYEKSEEFGLKYIKTLKSDRYRGFGERDYQLQRGYNRLAMCKYQFEQYDSALHYVNIAIDLIPTMDYPYSTLAETYAYMGNHEKFYEAIEKGMEHGFNFSGYLEEEPYNRYANDPRFLQMIKEDQEMAIKD
ncbi:MAG: tetratricopeptide repeat protein [Bacteroidota bacterium]